MLGDIEPSLINEFLSETSELLEQLDMDLLALEQSTDAGETSELLASLFRALHTVKGAASFLSLEAIATFAHAAEDALNHLRHGTVAVTPAIVDVLLQSADLLRRQVDDLREGRSLSQCPEDLMAGLQGVSAQATGGGADADVTSGATDDDPSRPERPLELPPQKVDLVGYMAADLVEATETIETVLRDARDQASRAEAADVLAETASGMARTAAFFELDDLHALVSLLTLAAERIDGLDDVLVDDTLRRLQAVVDLVRTIADAIGRSRVPVWELETFLDRTRGLLEGRPDPSAGGDSSSAADVLRADGVIDAGGPVIASADAEGRSETVAAATESSTNAGTADADAGGSSGAGARSGSMGSGTIRVEVERLESLLNLVGQLVLTKNRVLGLSRRLQEASLEPDLLEEVLLASNELDRLTGSLQSGVTNTRLQPLAKLFDRYPRVIRDIARGTGKKIRLEIIGKETEVDKGVLEFLGDPLVHILRNSADHGIEHPEDRVAAGKDELGTIRLIAEHQGSHVRIAIEDDGRGIDRDRVAAKAIEQGLVTPEQVAGSSDAEILQFVFAAGFSTAEQVSDLSGRGVGMDVVATNIRRMNGTVQVDSVPGRGTTIDITIPLTVAIMPAMVVGVGQELYCIPLMNIVEIVRSDPKATKHANGQPVIRLRDEVLPLLGLNRILGGEPTDAGRFAIIVDVSGQRAGLLVDHLVGQQEIVIKPLDDVQSSSGFFSGATIRESGDVSLILDVNRLLRAELAREADRRALVAASSEPKGLDVDQKYVDAVVDAAENVFVAMVRTPLEVGHVSACDPAAPKHDVSAIISLSGAMQGALILSFPTTTAERIVSVFVDEELDRTHEDFADALGELANMVTGSAKASFGGGLVSISCPSVVIGQSHAIAINRDLEHVTIPCTCDLGEFSMFFSMRQAVADDAGASCTQDASAA